MVIGAAICGIVDTDGLAARFADVEAFSTLVTFSADASRGDAVGDTFEQGAISARLALGMFVALAGGLLAIRRPALPTVHLRSPTERSTNGGAREMEDWLSTAAGDLGADPIDDEMQERLLAS